MKKLHIALAVANLEKSIVEYTKRLGAEPVSVAKGQYALWRTAEVNLSINENPDEAGQLRHLGFERWVIEKLIDSLHLLNLL